MTVKKKENLQDRAKKAFEKIGQGLDAAAAALFPGLVPAPAPVPVRARRPRGPQGR